MDLMEDVLMDRRSMLSPVTSKAQTKALLEPWLRVKLPSPWWILNSAWTILQQICFQNALRRRTKLHHDTSLQISWYCWDMLRLSNYCFFFFPGRVGIWHVLAALSHLRSPKNSSAEILSAGFKPSKNLGALHGFDWTCVIPNLIVDDHLPH